MNDHLSIGKLTNSFRAALLIAVAAVLCGRSPCTAESGKYVDSHGVEIRDTTTIDQNTGSDQMPPAIPDGNASRQEAVTSAPTNPDVALPSSVQESERKDNYIIVTSTETGRRGAYLTTGREIIKPEWGNLIYLGQNRFAGMKYYDDSMPRWFLMNGLGKILSELPSWTQPSYHEYHDGLMLICEDPATYIDLNGQIAFKADGYFNPKDFSFGFAPVQYSDKEGSCTGYIDRKGKIAFGPFRNAGVEPFYEGCGIIFRPSEDSAMIDTSGKFVVPFGKYERITAYYDRNFLAHLKTGGLAIIDRKGNELIRLPGITNIGLNRIPDNDFIPCTTCEIETPPDKVLWGYCDRHGNIRIKPQFNRCGEFIGTNAVAYTKTGEEQACGVIDQSGKWVLPPVYASVTINDPNRFYVVERASKVSTSSFASIQGSPRSEVALRIFRSNNLIDMSLEDLEKLFEKANPVEIINGDPKITQAISYQLNPGAKCGNVSLVLQFGLNADKKVVGWRTFGISGHTTMPWITENVTPHDLLHGFELGNLVPKEQ